MSKKKSMVLSIGTKCYCHPDNLVGLGKLEKRCLSHKSVVKPAFGS